MTQKSKVNSQILTEPHSKVYPKNQTIRLLNFRVLVNVIFALQNEKTPGGLGQRAREREREKSYTNTGLLAELVALRIAKIVVRIEACVQCGYQVEQRLSRDCITKVSTFSIFITVTEASAGTEGREKRELTC